MISLHHLLHLLLILLSSLSSHYNVCRRIYNVNATATDSEQLSSMNNTCWPTDTCPPPVLYYQLRRGGYVKLSLQCTLDDPVTAAPEINPDLVYTTPHATDIGQSDPLSELWSKLEEAVKSLEGKVGTYLYSFLALLVMCLAFWCVCKCACCSASRACDWFQKCDLNHIRCCCPSTGNYTFPAENINNGVDDDNQQTTELA